MSEPTAFADHVESVVPGVVHWTVHDDRIGFRSDAYGVDTSDGKVLIDPLPLSEEAVAKLGRVSAIVLIEGQHQRSSWTLRRRFKVPIHAPEGAVNLEESPDVWYVDGDRLPGNLRAVETEGFGTIHCALLLEREGGRRVVFSGDLVVREAEDGPLSLIPDAYVDDPKGIRASVAKLIDLVPDTLCPGHGAPIAAGAGESLQEALRRESDQS